jgi:hypothetical protein
MVRRILAKMFGIKTLDEYKEKVLVKPKYLKKRARR